MGAAIAPAVRWAFSLQQRQLLKRWALMQRPEESMGLPGYHVAARWIHTETKTQDTSCVFVSVWPGDHKRFTPQGDVVIKNHFVCCLLHKKNFYKMHWWWSKVYCKCILPEQLNSCFCTSATLSPLSSGGAVHCVNKPIVGLCLSHWANHARWQSQFRLFEWRRLLNERGKKRKVDWLKKFSFSV